MPLADLQRRADLQMEEDDRAFAFLHPANAFVPEEEPPFSDLECVVYHDPEHRISADLDALERRVRGEIAPRHRDIRFESLSREDLRFWTPFATRAEEDDYLLAGHARGPGSWDGEAGAPDFPAGGPAHHRVRHESLRALHCLVLIAQATLRAARTERPEVAWLGNIEEHILAPVCGREAGPEEDNKRPEMPIAMQGGLLVGCNDFRRRVHDSSFRPQHAEHRADAGREAPEGPVSPHRGGPAQAGRLRTGRPSRPYGRELRPCGGRLWICQTVMEMRLSAEEVRRRYSRSFFRIGDDAQVHNREDGVLRARLRGEHRGQRDFIVPRITRVAPTLERRLLTIFHGGPVQPIDEACARGGAGFPGDDRGMFEWSQVEALVRWIGDLRRTGRATLGPWVANMVLQLVYRENEGDDIRLSTWDPDCPSSVCSAASDALLTDMLPQAAWLALVEAASHVRGERM